VQRAVQNILVGLVQLDVRHAHSSPAAFNRNKNLRCFLDERLLLIPREHQIPISLFRRSESRKNPAPHTEIRLAHVGTFFGARKAKRDPSEVGSVQRNFIILRQLPLRSTPQLLSGPVMPFHRPNRARCSSGATFLDSTSVPAVWQSPEKAQLIGGIPEEDGGKSPCTSTLPVPRVLFCLSLL
jgi:hypothetical protein